MKTHLKLEAYTLAQRSRIMRKYERSLAGGHPLRTDLANKRRVENRREARAVHLAYCFLRGRSYEQVEQNPRTKPNWQRVIDLVKEHGGRYYEDRNVTAFEDLQLNWRPDIVEEHDRIVRRSQEKKVRVRPSNRG